MSTKLFNRKALSWGDSWLPAITTREKEKGAMSGPLVKSCLTLGLLDGAHLGFQFPEGKSQGGQSRLVDPVGVHGAIDLIG